MDAQAIQVSAAGEESWWHLKVAYDGSAYRGWQVQPDCATVQGELLKRLRLMLRAPELKIYGSSRTDSGVHALDQQVSFQITLPNELSAEDLKRRLNRWLPDDIVVKSVRLCPGPFNARYDNCGKAYTYCISPGVKVNPLFCRWLWRTPHKLDIDAMREAAAILQGEHDFASFAVNPGREIESTVRNLRRLEVHTPEDGMVYVVAVGDSFLYKMVRSLTGYLVHVGYGYATPEDARRVLEGRNRSLAADSAPACGLFLAKVFYDSSEMAGYQPVLPPFNWQSVL
ncbi:MAG: tRNA pseudouridine(38-40) synthase TruA [Victivallales bacterium]|nr:tRNA pseudouridine(38-40) synthase TruA [Victivallales bacterium]